MLNPLRKSVFLEEKSCGDQLEIILFEVQCLDGGIEQQGLVNQKFVALDNIDQKRHQGLVVVLNMVEVGIIEIGRQLDLRICSIFLKGDFTIEIL